MDIRGSSMAEQPESLILSALKVTDFCINHGQLQKEASLTEVEVYIHGYKSNIYKAV